MKPATGFVGKMWNKYVAFSPVDMKRMATDRFPASRQVVRQKSKASCVLMWTAVLWERHEEMMRMPFLLGFFRL